MSTIKCKFCNADNETDRERCFSCNAPLPKRSNIQGKDKENLTNYIKSVESMLNAAKKRADSKIALFFLGIVIIWGAGTITLYNYYQGAILMLIVLSVVLALALFIIFGFFIGNFEDREIAKIYNAKIKKDILEYLTLMHYQGIDFKSVAAEVLEKEAKLFKFLDDF